MRKDWRSYDPIAETYEGVAERQYFAKPASALVSLLSLALGSREYWMWAPGPAWWRRSQQIWSARLVWW